MRQHKKAKRISRRTASERFMKRLVRFKLVIGIDREGFWA
jgi:hypothetical protein